MQKDAPYAEAVRLKYPEQVVIAIARDARGKCNPITLGWTMITSHEPPMMAISIGLGRYSLEAVRSAGEFVVVFPSEHQEAETMLFGTKSGRDVDKLAEVAARTSPATKIDCVILDDAVANFECKVVAELATGDHVLFVGRVVACHVNAKPLNRLYTCGAGYKMGGLSRKA